jgi:hypothetical protein
LAACLGLGKTTIVRELAHQAGARHLRIDSMEQAIRDCAPDAAGFDEAGDRVAYAVAEDNFGSGGPSSPTRSIRYRFARDACLEVGRCAPTVALEIEIIGSDLRERQSESQPAKLPLPDLRPPTWDEVIS